MLDGERRSYARRILPALRDRLTPEDMLAVAFDGLARRRIWGSHMGLSDARSARRGWFPSAMMRRRARRPASWLVGSHY